MDSMALQHNQIVAINNLISRANKIIQKNHEKKRIEQVLAVIKWGDDTLKGQKHPMRI